MRSLFLLLAIPAATYGQALEFVRVDHSGNARADQIAKAPKLPAETAIVKLDFKKPVIRVEVKSERFDHDLFRCDVGLSEDLIQYQHEYSEPKPKVVVIPAQAQAQPPGPVMYEMLAKNLKVGDQAHLTFDSHLDHHKEGMAAGLVVRFTKRRRQVVVELEPRYVMPSGFEGALSEREFGQTKVMFEQGKHELSRTRLMPSGTSDAETAVLRDKALEMSRSISEDHRLMKNIEEYVLRIREKSNVYVRVYIGNRVFAGVVK